MAFVPIAQAGVGVDVAFGAQGVEHAAPVCRQLAGAGQVGKGVVAAGHQHAGKGQALAGGGCPAGDFFAVVGPFNVGRGHQQGAADAVGLGRVGGPPGGEDATQAVRGQQQRAGRGGQHGVLQAGRPVAAQGALPVVLLNPGVAVARLPMALPVAGAAAQPAGQDEDGGGLGRGRSGHETPEDLKNGRGF